MAPWEPEFIALPGRLAPVMVMSTSTVRDAPAAMLTSLGEIFTDTAPLSASAAYRKVGATLMVICESE
ncbi:MAG: hypothetical protein GWM88_15490 [Pseudomonadales bacterium]|nr:hypothetical protein [Pseudomonadales bacterium]NIX09340.1 hypothetical protein [Pseudomonadales bacterium]